MKTIVIAAPMSGSGKTTVTLGLMESLKRRGFSIAPFKVGPDFIDPGWHRLATGRTSVNLDGWMCREGFVRQTFAMHARGCDLAVIEGVMGLFDGIDGVSDAGSTAQIARFLEAPVILVVDARSQARSAAALVRGFSSFDSDVHVAGVIFNNVGSDSHARILRDAMISAVPEVRILGCIPRDERLRIPSRHLGLVTVDQNPLPDDFLDCLSSVIEGHVDLEGILSLTSPNSSLPPGGGESGWGGKCQDHRSVSTSSTPQPSVKGGRYPVRIAVARDAAFCFVYEDNLRLLREAGAGLVEFSPLADSGLPERIGGIYLPGGYPELFAGALAANVGMKQEIRSAIEKGMPVYAECGGFIYLTENFVGVFPVSTRMLPRRKALGYREVELMADAFLGLRGAVARGHEFHYSEMDEMPDTIERVYRVRKNGLELGFEGYRYRNCLASYIHLHFGSCPEMASAFMERCRHYLGHSCP